MRTPFRAASLDCALVILFLLTTTATSFPTASNRMDSVLLSVTRRRPSQYNNGLEPALSVSEARFDYPCSTMAQTWTDVKRYFYEHFRSYTTAFREYIPPPSAVDETSVFYSASHANVVDLPPENRVDGSKSHASPLQPSTSGSSSLSTGAIVGIVVGVVALMLVAFSLAILARKTRAGHRRRYPDYQEKLPKWSNGHGHAEAAIVDDYAASNPVEEQTPTPTTDHGDERPVTPLLEERIEDREEFELPGTRAYS